MKSAVKIGLSLIVGIIAGSVVTDYFWRSYFNTLRDAQQLSFTIIAEQQAESAYFNRSPEIAELELTRLLAYLDSPPPLVRTDPREQPFKRFVAHARLAKVQQAQGKLADAEQHFQAALSNMRTAFPESKAASAADVLTTLATIDDAAKKHQ